MHLEPPYEAARLAQRYEALSDGELLKLYQELDELTDEAQHALKAELRSRRLDPSAAVVRPARPLANASEFEMVPEKVQHGLIYLTGLENGIDLALACDYLSEAGIDLAVEESEFSPQFHNIYVAPVDVARGKQVLRETMSLFPLPEKDAPQIEGKGYIDDGRMLVLGQFENESEREQTAEILRNAGVEFKLSAGDPEEYDPALLVEVHAADLNRALALVVDGLGAEE